MNLKLNKDNRSMLESVDDQMISLLRLLLSISAILVIYIDPSEPDRFEALTYFTLTAYCIYSAIVYLLVSRKITIIPMRSSHWIDVAWYSLLISLSSGTNSVFFFFYIFSILVAAFRWGFGSGLAVATVSAVLFTVIGWATTPAEQAIELNRFLLRPIYLLLLGYMISFWGGREIKLRKRLALLKDVNRLSNPRFGVDQTLFSVMRRLRLFYDADSCLLILKPSSGENYFWREVSRDDEDETLIAEQTDAAIPLLSLSGDYSLLYQSNKYNWLKFPNIYVLDSINDRQIENSGINFAALADLLEAKSFISIPLHQHGELVGRLYLTSQKNPFDNSDTEFIRQIIEQIIPAIENIQLLDLLASEAVEKQRQKISRDIHDSTIQPYIGLKLGLEALEIKSSAGRPISEDINRLIDLADTSIADLRGFINKLKGESTEQTGDVLITALQQQAGKFQQFYGIKVIVNSDHNFRINDRLAAEVFQMIMEGLSNVRRHTKAKSATVGVTREAEKLVITIENIPDQAHAAKDFIPKSIKGRTEALGGEIMVERLSTMTRILVKIPL